MLKLNLGFSTQSAIPTLAILFQFIFINQACDYTESFDLTGYQNFPNGSYFYKDTLISADLVTFFDYKIDNITLKRISVNSHPRICSWKLKPRITFCCPPYQKHNTTHCETFTKNYSFVMNITSNEGVIEEKDISLKFSNFIQKPNEGYFLDPEDVFSLFENGTLLRHYDMAYLTIHEYCLTPFDGNNSVYLLPIFYYPQPVELKFKNILDAVCMLISVFFMVLTIIVYMGVPKLRTLHGKSLCCYLLNLCFGYSIMAVATFYPMLMMTHPLACEFLGYFGYSSFMTSFFWLSLISIDMYQHIVRSGRSALYQKFSSFKWFCIYSWGLGLVCLVLTYFAQNSSLVSNYWKPKIGDPFCCLDFLSWSASIYFYAPLMVIILFNIIMFVRTALYIYTVKKNMTKMLDETKAVFRNNSEQLRFGIFFRLFIAMGITWSMEIVSYLAGQKFDCIFIFTDICNGIQGLTIFILFVLKKRVIVEISACFNKTLQRLSSSSAGTRLSDSNPNQLSKTGGTCYVQPQQPNMKMQNL